MDNTNYMEQSVIDFCWVSPWNFVSSLWKLWWEWLYVVVQGGSHRRLLAKI